MQPWLSKFNFVGRISLPTGFDLDVLEPFITDAADGWLYDLLGADKYKALGAYLNKYPYGIGEDGELLSTSDDAFNTNLFVLVSPFLVYAAWSGYVLEGNIIPTTTGLVEKNRADSLSITDAHRAELRRAYREKAERYAVRIADYLQKNAGSSCTGPARTSGVRIGKAAGRTQSRFPDYPTGFGPYLIIPDANSTL